MIVATILPLLATAAAATPTQPAPRANSAGAPAKCDPFRRTEQTAVLRGSGPLAQRLDQLPAGNLHLAVDRQINGCHQPVIVRENFGGAFRPR